MDKSYSKRLILEKKFTRQRLEEDEKRKGLSQVDSHASKIHPSRKTSDEWETVSETEKPGGFTPEGYRKHPHHKPSWGPYPSINISQTANAASTPPPVKNLDRRTLKLKIKEYVENDREKDEENGTVDRERSVGNISIRNVIMRLEKRSNASLYYRSKKIRLPWIIMFIAKYGLIWEILNYLNIVMSSVLISFSAFFSYFDEDLWDYISYLDWIFAADVLARLSVEIWRSKNRASFVVFTAPYTFLQFLLDIISMLPLYYIYFWVKGSSDLIKISKIDFYRLNSLIRLFRCVNFFDTLERHRMANEKLLFLFKFSNYYLAFIYFTSCLLVSCCRAAPLDYLLSNNLETKLRLTYLEDFDLKKGGYGCSPWDLFVLTTNFATAVITTVGYGDITPNSELEMSICIVCMLFGAIFLNGHFTGELTNFEVELDGARFDLYYRLKEIKRYLIKVNTRKFFNAKVEEYYNYLWTYREGVFDVSFMRAIPQTFHEELLFDLCGEMFDKSQFFNNLDPSFLRALSNVVTIALYNSNMILCRRGGYASKLFYILQGECQAMSKLNPANPSAVFRAGTIIGETNLIFSFPYTTTVETRTCCQFLIIKKQDLLTVAEQFPVELEIIRSRSLLQIKELFDTHQAYGVDPVCWVKARTDMENPSKPNAEKLRRTMRWNTGLNKEVLEDLVDDSEDAIIFDIPVQDPSNEKNHLIPYVSCAVPEIMNTDMAWIKLFNLGTMFVGLWFAFFGPYCLVYGEPTKLEYYVCKTQHYLNKVTSLIFMADVLVEIIGACPVAGWYYKFWDGLNVVRHQPTFYLDVLAALPLDMFFGDEDQNILSVIGTIFKICKLWKVIRFLHYLENVYPLKLFWFRLGQTILVLLYGIHFIACISYYIACPHDEILDKFVCNDKSWLGSYEINYMMENSADQEDIPKEMRATTLGYENYYLYSYFYSTAILTSAGFGDFNPQNRTEMLWSIGFMLFGFYLIGYYTAVLTSALSCLVRPKLALQQRLVSLCQFMDHYHLREDLKNRIIEYFVLQHQFRGGVPIDQSTHIMYDAPAYLRNDVLYLEVFELLDGVPVFSKLEAEVIIKLSGLLKRFIIPPNTTFVMKGEVRRILYIIKNGSMGVFEEAGSEKPARILEATTHFGLRDLLFGEPYHNVLKSLSYVSLYAIKRTDFEESLQYEDDFWDLVNEEKERIKLVIHEMTMLYANLTLTVSNDSDKATKVPSWIEIPPRVPPAAKKVLGQVETMMIEKNNLINDEYDQLFKGLRGARFLKMFLLRKTIHPAGYFSKFWNCFMSLVCCFTVITLMLETFCYIRMPTFRFFQICLDIINYVDIYLKFHWSYYNPHNLILVTHPLQTAMNYVLHGSFVLDIVVVAPIELVLWMFKLTTFLGYGKAATWYSRLRWIRFFQFKRIPVVFNITHDIYKNRNMILLFLYIISTLFLCTIISAIAQFIACPWSANDWMEGDQYRTPICGKKGWVAKKFENSNTNPALISGVYRRWVLGLYYVSQVILAIGFGDMITLNKADIVLLIFMCIFGFLFMRCVIADMTAAEVNSDEARAVFVENMKVLDLVMKRENVSRTLQNMVMSHLRYTWVRSRGLQTRELFGDLHPVLESELYRKLVGEKLSRIPIFNNFPKTVLRSLCRYTKTQYILRGERIMRSGNLEYSMCIIIHGKVLIADRNLNYVCSLGPGKSFGESSIIYALPRRFNAVAACNTEVFVLTAAHYQTFLGRYPNFKEEMKRNLSMQKRDYFEIVLEKKMVKAKKLSAEKKQQMLNTFEERTSMVKNLIMLKEDLVQSGLDAKEAQNYRRNRFVGYGDLEYDLPLLYFAVPTRKSFHFPVIHPNCGLMRRFLGIISWLCFFTPAIAAYEVCFSKDFLTSMDSEAGTNSFLVSKYLHDVSEVIEWTFLVYVFIQFFLAYEITPGVYNKSICCITMRYITALDGLFLDLLGCAPFIVEKSTESLEFNEFEFDDYLENIVSNLYLLRSIRLIRYYKSQLSKKDDLDVSTFRLQITLSVTSFCLMAHMLACLFYWISPCQRPDLTNGSFKFTNLCPPPDDPLDETGWTTEFTENKSIEQERKLLEAWRWWLRSLYWVVTTISTTGFGDIVPTTINEMAVGIICIFCGAFILSIILSQFTSGMASLTKSKREYMYQVLLLVKHLTNIGLSKIRQFHIMMYFLTMWNVCRGIPYHKAIRRLPITMKIELAYALFGDTLNKIPFFKISRGDNSFVRQLSIRVTHSMYIPGTYIHKDGDPGSTLFVVYKGTVSGTLVGPDGEPVLKSIYNLGDGFGHFAALFHDGVYKKSYRAENMVELLEVQQTDIIHLSKKFPYFKARITSYIESRYEPRGTNVNIFDRKRRKSIDDFGSGMVFPMQRGESKRLEELEERKRKREKKRKRKEKKELEKMLNKTPTVEALDEELEKSKSSIVDDQRLESPDEKESEQSEITSTTTSSASQDNQELEEEFKEDEVVEPQKHEKHKHKHAPVEEEEPEYEILKGEEEEEHEKKRKHKHRHPEQNDVEEENLENPMFILPESKKKRKKLKEKSPEEYAMERKRLKELLKEEKRRSRDTERHSDRRRSHSKGEKRHSHSKDERRHSRSKDERRHSHSKEERRHSHSKEERRHSHSKDEKRHSHSTDERRHSHSKDERRHSHSKDERRHSHSKDERDHSQSKEERRHSHSKDEKRHSHSTDEKRHSHSKEERRHSHSKDERRHSKDERRQSKDERRRSHSTDDRRHSDSKDERRHSHSTDERRHSHSKDERRHSHSKDERRHSKDERRHSKEERRQSKDERRQSKDERRQSKDERRHSKDERRQSKDERRRSHSTDDRRHSDSKDERRHSHSKDERRHSHSKDERRHSHSDRRHSRSKDERRHSRSRDDEGLSQDENRRNSRDSERRLSRDSEHRTSRDRDRRRSRDSERRTSRDSGRRRSRGADRKRSASSRRRSSRKR